MVAVYIVLKEACDTVQLLFEKTTKMGPRGTCGMLLRTYSEGRKHTNVNREDSETETCSGCKGVSVISTQPLICWA